MPDCWHSALARDVLPFVSKPARYIAGEWNSVRKDPACADVRVALAFPDTYEIGMCHLGLKILYQRINDRPDCMADRVYAPWVDAEALLRRRRIPLCGHESGRPLGRFDVLGFTLQYELAFPTILNMLELGGIPTRSADRHDGDPLVVAGGPVAFAPEPLAPFIDAFLIGDGEDAVLELCDVIRQWKAAAAPRADLLSAVKRIAGMYVPALHSPGEVVAKRTALRLDGIDYGRFPVPFMEIVHDRASLEVMRGCARGCRFCQAGYVYRPIREYAGASIEALAERCLAGSGYEELSLSALSIADLGCLGEIIPRLMQGLGPRRTSLSLPSLRVETLTRYPELAAQIAAVRKTGFTIAPEAGSARLRRVINKHGFAEEDILGAAERAAQAGWSSLKFYFMIGLPTETGADLDEIVRLAREAGRVARRARRGFGITVSASSFIPKPHTPFQWCRQEPMESLRDKQAYLKGRLRESRIDFKWHQVEASFLEAVLARGGREVGAAIARAAELGCRFDGWTEQLRFDLWMQAFEDTGVDPYAIANRDWPLDVPLPWEHIDAGVSKAYFLREYRRAVDELPTTDCHTDACNGCGAPCAPDWRAWADAAAVPAVEPGDPPAGAAGHASGSHPVEAGTAEPVQKIRFEFQKVGTLRFLSHLELMRAFARSLRRAGVPLAYSQGFNPQPRLSLAQALAVGVEGLHELGEVEFAQRIDPGRLAAMWNDHLPPELKILRSWEAPLHGPSLSAGVRGAVYQVQLAPNGWDAASLAALGSPEACAAFLAQDSLAVEVTKKGHTVALDARPFIQEFAPAGRPGLPCWHLQLRLGPTGGIKPTVVMRRFLEHEAPPGELDQVVAALRITRTALVTELATEQG
jgi:radical SAM family uncharacterized protein/radical SAM-linked protein